MHRIVFMGTPEFAVPTLQALMETHQVVGVVTQPDRPSGRGRQLRPSPVKEAALAADIPLYQPASLRKETALEPIRAWAPDAIVVAAFGQILRPHLLDLPPLGCINVHASLLPRWRGASPIQHAILAGDAKTGVTLMKMDPGLDTGPMYVMESISIAADETAASLHDKLSALGATMLRRYLDDILNGRLLPTPQDDTDTTYAPMISKSDGQIDWSQSAQQIDQHIRAMTPWPAAFTSWQGTQLKILAATPTSHASTTHEPGTVFATDSGIQVATGDGALMLRALQLAGKTRMDAEEFVRGRPDFVGSRLDDEAAV